MNIKTLTKQPAIFYIIILTLVLSSCGIGKKNNENGISGKVKIDGSSTVYPLSEAVAEEFRKEPHNIRLTIGSSGSGAGFKKFARGETDISNASRAIKKEEKKACKENNIKYKEMVVAMDGLAVVVHKDNNWIDSISIDQLANLWKKNSKIKKWSDMNPDWPDKKITLYGPNTAHGTFDFFTDAVTGDKGCREHYNAVSDYNAAVKGIASDKYALGYFGLAYYEENDKKLKVLSVAKDSTSKAVIPSQKTIKNNKYPVLARPLYMYVKKESAKKPAVQRFIKFFMNNAGELAQPVGYVPLKEERYDKQWEEFD
ncbi:MAG: PstS family phosphate ABC transporter substrate-binding protein [Flavobacteriales bacterium]